MSDIFFRVALTQPKLSVLPINNDMYRYSDCPKNRNCCICHNQVENEDHFFFGLSFVDRFKKQISGAKGCSVVTGHLTMERHKTLLTAIKVYFHAMKIRKLYIDV